jgi:hypothetical protein
LHRFAPLRGGLCPGGEVQTKKLSFKRTFLIFFYTNFLELPKG